MLFKTLLVSAILALPQFTQPGSMDPSSTSTGMGGMNGMNDMDGMNGMHGMNGHGMNGHGMNTAMSSQSDSAHGDIHSNMADQEERSSGHGHGMSMTFNNDMATALLLPQLVPQNPAGYILACSAIFAAAIFLEGLTAFAKIKESQLKRFHDEETLETGKGVNSTVDQRSPWFSNIAGFKQSDILPSAAFGILKIMTSGLAYLLMFVAMTLNIGFFVSIIVGHGVGHFLLAPVARAYL